MTLLRLERDALQRGEVDGVQHSDHRVLGTVREVGEHLQRIDRLPLGDVLRHLVAVEDLRQHREALRDHRVVVRHLDLRVRSNPWDHKGVEFLHDGAEEGRVEGEGGASRGNRLERREGAGGGRQRFLANVEILLFCVTLFGRGKQHFIGNRVGDPLGLGVLQNETLHHGVPCLSMITEQLTDSPQVVVTHVGEGGLADGMAVEYGHDALELTLIRHRPPAPGRSS